MKTLNFDTKYASESISVIPAGFIDKGICGCGLTTVALENEEDCIIAVPNVPLVENKVAQYPNDRCSYKIFGICGSVSTKDIDLYINELRDQPIKIMVTWDSLFKVRCLLDRCRLIIDESDNLITNMPLKTDGRSDCTREDIINELLSIAEEHKDTVSFITATPIPLNYLPDWISNIEQIKMNWANTIRISPILMKRRMPYVSLKNEIIIPLSNNKEITIGDRTFSKVCVFINSVREITSICRECNLSRKDVSILCSAKNKTKVRGYNTLVYNKLTKFNFITSTGFQGIDLYDNDCMNIVVSCTDVDYHLVDLATSLKQAISRNRSVTNPNRDRYIFVYNTFFERSDEEMMGALKELERSLKNCLSDINSHVGYWEDKLRYLKQSKDFIQYSYYKDGEYIFNQMRYNYDVYFLKEVRASYTRGFEIMGNGEYQVISETRPIYNEGATYSNIYNLLSSGKDASEFSYSGDYQLLQEYYSSFGTYNRDRTDAIKKLAKLKEGKISQITILKKIFIKDKDYTYKEVKEKLQEYYDSIGLVKKAKTTDLESTNLIFKRVAINGCRFIRFE